MGPMLPELVAAPTGRARSAGFDLSCDPSVGGLLAVLAAHLPAGSRILELGTGAGVGTAWIVSGLLPRTDVSVTTVEQDAQTAQLAAHGSWPAFTDLRRGDALAVLREGGGFDLIFADAPGGKHEGLDLTIAALNPRGLLCRRRHDPDPAMARRVAGETGQSPAGPPGQSAAHLGRADLRLGGHRLRSQRIARVSLVAPIQDHGRTSPPAAGRSARPATLPTSGPNALAGPRNSGRSICCDQLSA
jgi:demethylmenaquinone methyltransferase/2-methoxy-6-polyprenyl-1,4-benzoquinol methylase